MRHWLALKGLLFIFAIVAVILLALYGLLVSGITDPLIPSPKDVADQFVSLIQAGQHQESLDSLSQDLKENVSAEKIKELANQIQNQKQGIEDVQAEQSEENGMNATGSVSIEFGDKTSQTVQFPMVKENYVWKINSIGPLEAVVSH